MPKEEEKTNKEKIRRAVCSVCGEEVFLNLWNYELTGMCLSCTENKKND